MQKGSDRESGPQTTNAKGISLMPANRRQHRFEIICKQQIGSLGPAMERALRKGVSRQFVLHYMLCKLNFSLGCWDEQALLEPEDDAVQQAMLYVTGLAYARWVDAPLENELGDWRPKLIASRTKMRRTRHHGNVIPFPQGGRKEKR